MAADLELHSKMYVLNGLMVPRFIKQENLDKLKGLTLRDDVLDSVLSQGWYHMDPVHCSPHS